MDNSRMRSEGFPFYTFGGLGVEVCRWTPFLCSQPSATVCNRLQPFATVCNRLQPFATVCNRPRTTVVAESCRAYGKSCKRRDFWMFQVLRSFISRGRHGTLWHVAARLSWQKVAVPMGKVSECVVVWSCQMWCSLWEKLQNMWFLSCVL